MTNRIKHYRVEFSPEALEHAQAIRTWWIEHRTAAPNLFVDELSATIRKLAIAPHAGARYGAEDLREMRRMLMMRTRHHVYYTVDDNAQLVRIFAIWHTARGQGPR